jgi:hypothetical protein
MEAFWGDRSWRDAAYSTTGNLFGWPEKQRNEVIAEAFRDRLKKVAGFERVPDPVPMRNSKGAILGRNSVCPKKPPLAQKMAIFGYLLGKAPLPHNNLERFAGDCRAL